MNKIKFLALAAIAAIAIAPGAPKAAAQVSVTIGVAPDCPYGYYDYAPYNCVPDGYYGPEWFNGGAFIGVGPWFHGSNDFQGKVDNTFDPQHGYSGSTPKVGDKPAAQRRSPEQFKGNETRDGRGHTAGLKPTNKNADYRSMQMVQRSGCPGQSSCCRSLGLRLSRCRALDPTTTRISFDRGAGDAFRRLAEASQAPSTEVGI